MSWIGLAVFVAGGPVTAATAGPALKPHVAAYHLTLANGYQPGDMFVDVQGGLVIEWRRSCDGWLSHQRLAFVASTEEGPNVRHDIRFSSWEALDGSRLRYVYRSYSADQLQDDFSGEANLDPDAGGTATFTAPEDRDIELPPGTVFPTSHLSQVMAVAGGGERFVSHKVFDGAGYDALTQITSVIGQSQLLEPTATGGERERAWPVSMAYYDLSAPGDTPKFEASFLLGENGVLRDVGLDYGEFKLEGTLDRVELLPPPDC